jgi:hypothetical protein
MEIQQIQIELMNELSAAPRPLNLRLGSRHTGRMPAPRRRAPCRDRQAHAIDQEQLRHR